MAIGVTFFAAILMLPLIFQAVSVRWPIQVSAKADRLTIGVFRSFTLRHITGVVVDASSYNEVRTATTYDDRGMVIDRSTRSTLYETIYIRVGDGKVYPVSIVNYNFQPPKGYVVSVWSTNRGSKDFTVAAINHTASGAEYVNDQQLFEIVKPNWSQILFVLYLCALVLPIALLSVFGGKGLPLLLFLPLLFMYVTGVRKTLRKFRGKGLDPIRNVSRHEAGYYMQAAG